MRAAGEDRRRAPAGRRGHGLAGRPLEDDRAYPERVVADAPRRTRAARTSAESNPSFRSSPTAGLRAIIDDLYDELGPASFTVSWQHDPRGLLTAALAFLGDLRLLRRVDAGVLVLPAAARYRNIKAALPVRHAEGQLALDLFGSERQRRRRDD